MDETILNLFKNIYEKQNELSILTDSKLFNAYSISEVHTIDLIGSKEKFNGVLIADELKLTRSAVSKILSKLRKNGLIESYKNDENKKEIYYKLTAAGLEIYNSHQKSHRDWEERELKFFKCIDITKKKIINEFLEDYNKYLSELIKERG
ncbi:transcriptional regulator, MarR family [Clostridium cavendishii DSM 21758]|uniref:Transcriptional regulator, MarR family n=1 Tax=Clostridium cavendishii DSM 21758 TaxID=1121302 RepID=A0A1M6LHS7_9CLOT|nr:MarR family transcriptional regulator [Clostridium cavendishii]SHJ70713.1 transcriptional regulator, MarR family [Clostridium cavendishii DSM 21758]